MDNKEPTDTVEGEALPLAEGNDGDRAFADKANEGACAAKENAHPPMQDEDPYEQEEADEDRYEEIERNGKTATIPAWLKPELMMQTDYTRKTQELANARRTFETEREEVQQATQAELSAVANLNVIDRQIDDLTRVDWNAWHDSDPVEAQNAFARLQLFKNARSETLGFLDSLRQERTDRAQQEAVRRHDHAVAELVRDVNDWSPELSAKLFDFGQRHYGFSRDDLEGIDDARAIKALHAAYQWEEHQAKQRQAERLVAAQGVRPAAKVGGAAPKSGLDDRLSAEEWLRRRNAQLGKQA